LATLFTSIILFGTAIFAYKAYKEANKTRKDHNVLELIKYLQGEDMRLARRTLMEDIKKLPYHVWRNIPEKRNAAEKVCAVYDMVGLMLDRGLIDEDLVMEWKDSITKCYEAAKPMIDAYTERSGPSYYQNLNYLYNVVKPVKNDKDVNNKGRIKNSFYSFLDKIDKEKITLITTAIVIIGLTLSCYYTVRTSAIHNVYNSRQNNMTYIIYANSFDKNNGNIYADIAACWQENEKQFQSLVKTNTYSLNWCALSLILISIALIFALFSNNKLWELFFFVSIVAMLLAIAIHIPFIGQILPDCFVKFDWVYKYFGLLNTTV